VQGVLADAHADEGRQVDLHRPHGELHSCRFGGRQPLEPVLQRGVGRKGVGRLGVGVLGVPLVPDGLHVHVRPGLEVLAKDGGA
jgi:hypothetical protein